MVIILFFQPLLGQWMKLCNLFQFTFQVDCLVVQLKGCPQLERGSEEIMFWPNQLFSQKNEHQSSINLQQIR